MNTPGYPSRRDVVRMVLEGKKPPYTPWSFSFTVEAKETLCQHYQSTELDDVLYNHILGLGSDIGFFEPLGNDLYKDVFGVVWDRSVDKDIGNVKEIILSEPDLSDYTFPDPCHPVFFENIKPLCERHPGMFRVFRIGFSLFERAWTLRGMENLMIDFMLHPGFVYELMEAIASYNISQIRKALEYDIDAVYFGDDWGQQKGLIMGPGAWRDMIRPHLKNMYQTVRDAGKFVMIHSCGDVKELFDDLVEIGVDCFNPFQPEVMDVFALMDRYRGTLSFHGGLSTQKTLPYATPGEVRAVSEALLEKGKNGSYIFSPAHAVEGDVPLANMLAFIECARKQLR